MSKTIAFNRITASASFQHKNVCVKCKSGPIYSYISLDKVHPLTIYSTYNKKSNIYIDNEDLIINKGIGMFIKYNYPDIVSTLDAKKSTYPYKNSLIKSSAEYKGYNFTFITFYSCECGDKLWLRKFYPQNFRDISCRKASVPGEAKLRM